jgi:ornithine cyclodeaminase/alanine dehydrogenase-like protein (mu-crystallin family)
VVCVFPHNVRLGKDSHQGGVLLFDGRTGELLIGAGAGRSSAEEITLFKSLGLAIEDLAAAQYLYDKARATKAGTWAEF